VVSNPDLPAPAQGVSQQFLRGVRWANPAPDEKDVMPDAEEALDPITDDERTLAMFFWLVDIALHVIGPWLLWRLTFRGSKYLEHHAKTAANHTLTVLVLILIACVVFGIAGYVCLELEQNLAGIIVLCVPLAIVVVLALFSFVVHLIGATKAKSGVWFTPPLCWPFVKMTRETASGE
jgi:uncharacterized Tic20 family protein